MVAAEQLATAAAAAVVRLEGELRTSRDATVAAEARATAATADNERLRGAEQQAVGLRETIMRLEGELRDARAAGDAASTQAEEQLAAAAGELRAANEAAAARCACGNAVHECAA